MDSDRDPTKASSIADRSHAKGDLAHGTGFFAGGNGKECYHMQ
jgi:hypothetical protein